MDLARDIWLRVSIAVRRTPGLLAVSLFLGAAIWVVVTDIENPTRIELFPASITVVAVNVAPELAVANALQFVQVRLSASDEAWEQLTVADLRAVVDLHGLEAREQEVVVEVSVHDLRGVRVIGVAPERIVVNLEPFETRDVEVATRLLGTVPLGYEVASVIPAVTAVAVEGPESLVRLVREAAADVNVTGLEIGLEQTVSLVARGEGGGEIRGVRLDPATIRVAVEIDPTTLDRVVALRAVISGEPANGYRVTGVRVTPSTVRIEGDIGPLQGVQEIALTAFDISGAMSSTQLLVPIIAPAGTDIVGTAEATVFVTVAPVQGSLRLDVSVTVRNVGSGLRATIAADAVSVLLAGPLAALATVGADNLEASIDLSGLAVGSHAVTVNVRPPSDLTITSVTPQSLSVTLSVQ